MPRVNVDEYRISLTNEYVEYYLSDINKKMKGAKEATKFLVANCTKVHWSLDGFLLWISTRWLWWWQIWQLNWQPQILRVTSIEMRRIIRFRSWKYLTGFSRRRNSQTWSRARWQNCDDVIDSEATSDFFGENQIVLRPSFGWSSWCNWWEIRMRPTLFSSKMPDYLWRSGGCYWLNDFHRYFQRGLRSKWDDHRPISWLSLGIFIADFRWPKNGRHRSRVATGELDDDIAMAGGLKVDIDKVFASAD